MCVDCETFTICHTGFMNTDSHYAASPNDPKFDKGDFYRSIYEANECGMHNKTCKSQYLLTKNT